MIRPFHVEIFIVIRASNVSDVCKLEKGTRANELEFNIL